MTITFVLPSIDQEPIVPTRGGGNLAKQNEIINEEIAGLHGTGVSGECSEAKKVFVEPTISVPVDVLEATTFFQASSSGSFPA